MRFTLPLLLLVPCLVFPFCAKGQCPPPVPQSPPWLTPPSAPFAHHLALPTGTVSAQVYVDPSPSGEGLHRPFVFVEGIDFGLSGSTEAWRHGDFGWRQFHGCDVEAYPMMAHMPVLLDSLRHRGFTPVLIDFADGTADLRHNALLLADILRHLRDHRLDVRPMVLAGASMGGQLARMALRHLEIGGELHCQHLYVSLDSPHEGANVPLGLQLMLDFLSGDDGLVDDLIGALASPAARQLLDVQRLPLAPRVAQRVLMDSLGYPERCRNIGIANGSCTPLSGADQPLLHYEHALIESGLLGEIGEILTLEIHPQPGAADHPHSGPEQAVLTVLEHPSGSGWPWPLQLQVGYADMVSDLPWDHLPGGTRPSLHQFAEAFNATVADSSLSWPLCIPPIAESQVQALHSFIPTASALGLEVTSVSLDSALFNNSPFDAVHWGLTNEPHSEINPANLAFLLHELDQVECPIPPGTALTDTNITAGASWKLGGFSAIGPVGLHSTSLDFGNSASPPGTHDTLRLQGCGAPVHIQPTGHLLLGSENGNSSIHLIIESGASLIVEGPLTVHTGSTLEVEAGGHLEFRGGTLDLRSEATLMTRPHASMAFRDNAFWSCAEQSAVFLEGDANLDANVHWSVHWSGLVTWSTSQAFAMAGQTGSELHLHALENGHGWHIGHQGYVTAQGLSRWVAVPFGLHLGGQARLELELTESMDWQGNWRGQHEDSVLVTGDLDLTHVQLEVLHLRQSSGSVRLDGCSGQSGSALFLGKSTIVDSEFDAFPVSIFAPSGSANSRVESCVFEHGTLGLRATGPTSIHVEECAFQGLDIGADFKQGAASILCSEFLHNDIGLRTDRSLILMTPEQGGGWNRFESNDAHMRFIQSPLPQLWQGANHFGTWGSHWAQGSLDLACAGSGLDWDISGQSWNWPSGWPQIQGGLHTTSQPPCPVHAIDLSPLEALDCGAGLDRKKG